METNKHVLHVEILKIKQIRLVSFYTIEISVLNLQWTLDKRYNEFYALNEALKNRHFQGLPNLPAKTYFQVRN